MPTLTSVSLLEKLEEIKSVIRSLLISVPKHQKDVTPVELNKMYNEMEGKDIPYKDYNFTNLTDFLKSLNGVVRVRFNSKKQVCVYQVDNEKTQHISSLVAKADSKKSKKPKNLKNGKFQANIRHYSNTVNPYLLFDLFNKLLRRSSNRNRSSISKMAFLNELAKESGAYSFFEMENLNRQLDHYSHILSYDDVYINFKNNQTSNVGNAPFVFNCVGDLIRGITKDRLQKLVEKFPQGISCSELPEVFRHEYKMSLEYEDLGFSDILEFVVALPHILKIVKARDGKQNVVIDAKKTENDLYSQNHTVNFQEQNEDRPSSPNAVPEMASPKVSKQLIPDFAVSCEETLTQLDIHSLLKERCRDVTVSDVYSPSFFWVTLLKNKKKITSFSNAIDSFYRQQKLDLYEIPPVVLQPGLHVACVFNDLWYRGIVRKICQSKIGVLLYDFGTLCTYKSNELFFLDKKFADYPIQAIPCRLYNVRPLNNIRWTREYCEAFSNRVLNKFFGASVVQIDKETNSAVIDLIDHKRGLYISQWMIEEKLALEGEFISEKNHLTLKYYQQCLITPEKLKEEIYKKEIEKEKAAEAYRTDKYVTQDSLSMSRKLEIMRRWKERLSSSSQDSSAKEEQENCCRQPLNSSEDLLDSTLTSSGDSSSESCVDGSDYRITEHESSFTSNCSTLSSFVPSSTIGSKLDSDDLERQYSCESSVNNNLNEVVFKSCNRATLQFIESNRGSTEKKKDPIKSRREDLLGNSTTELERLLALTRKNRQ